MIDYEGETVEEEAPAKAPEKKMSAEQAEFIEKFEQFFDLSLSEKVSELNANYPVQKSIDVPFMELEKFDPDLADLLLENPDLVVPSAEQALFNLAPSKPKAIAFEPHVRFFDLPNRIIIENIGSDCIGKLVAIEALVTKRGELRQKLKKAYYECFLCGATQTVDLTKDGIPPKICDTCKRRSLKLNKEKSEFINLQRAEIQELLENLKAGAPAAHVHMVLEDDLVNVVIPGERIEVTGILRLREMSDESEIYIQYIEVVSVKKLKKDFEELELTKDEEDKITSLSQDPDIYKKITNSVAPSIYGHEEVKEGIALQLFGGTPGKTLRDGGEIRSDIHILLIGDPGAAKTRLLQFVHALAPKSIYVSGKSVTGAGLTASAEKDEIGGERGWVLKAGALVLASGGIGSIDEFDKIGKNDISALHEVMESQTVSVAKAGIVTQFKAKTSILAAANPKFGRFDPNMLAVEQFNISETLLSRFDLIFAMKDVMDEEKDRKVAEHILKSHKEAGEAVQAGKKSENIVVEDQLEDALSQPFLKRYIAYARKNVFPVLSDEAKDRIRDYYTSMRRLGRTTGTVTATARQIEALVRMSESSAKMRLAKTVTLEDAERVIRLMDFVAKSIYTDKETGRLDIDIITTGQPRSKVEKYKTIINIVEELSKQFDSVPIEEVLKESGNFDIDRGTAERLVQDLISKGELYTPSHGHVRITSRS